MPGFDKTGPDGMGPMTGGARGYCAQPAPGFVGQGRASSRWGRGFGLHGRGCRGMGIGRGAFGYQTVSAVMPFNTPMTTEQRRSELQRQAQFIRSELGQIQIRIAQLTETTASNA